MKENKTLGTDAVWSKVDTTDPKYTKKVNQRGGFTAIGAQYQLKKATELFGPFGKGWGVSGESFHHYENDGLFLYSAMLWYKLEGDDTEYRFPINSSIIYNRNGRIDDDFAKKVATDALTKGLSKLGFNADVFMGLFDDNKYVASLSSAKVVKKAVKSITSEQTLIIEEACKTIPSADANKVLTALSGGKITPSNFDATLEKLNGLLVKNDA
tara:strand:+ start:408 stop:1043 length:636 start_codon:yes stop_codon:yes gene_type:complete